MRDGVDQDATIAAIAAVNPRTIVVLKNGGPVLMPWLSRVPAVLEAWYPGQEDGNAVANLLFGIANPSGKLPVSFPKSEREHATGTPEQWPGTMQNGVRTATYSEQLLIGYRWFDAKGIQPLFAFGHGLSYTTFAISKLKVAPKKSDGARPIAVQFEVENTGSRAGAEVPQVYLQFPAEAGEPPKRLVAFQKIALAAGEKKIVRLTVDPRATNHPLGYWDSGSRAWAVAEGDYQISVGNSTAASLLRETISVRKRR